MSTFLKNALDPDARLHLLCFAPAGAGASFFRPWRTLVASDVQLCPLALPGHESRMSEKPYSCLEDLVADLVQELRPVLVRPFALFGHSFGALLAFELGRAMQSTERPPAHVFVAGCGALHLPMPLDHQDLRLPRAMVPIFRADVSLCAKYVFQPLPLLDAPLSVYGGQTDPVVSHASIEAWTLHYPACKRRMFPGGHAFARTEAAAVVAAILEDVE